jgi:hypothetical protein
MRRFHEVTDVIWSFISISYSKYLPYGIKPRYLVTNVFSQTVVSVLEDEYHPTLFRATLRESLNVSKLFAKFQLKFNISPRRLSLSQ